MATNTLIQKLDPVADGFGASASNRRQVETFIAGGTIATGDAVALDTSKTGADRALYVVEAPANSGALVVGIALNGASANETIAVVVTGYAAGANVESGVLAGQALYVGTTAGRLAAISGAATATSSAFLSTLQTGTAGVQNIAHGLGVVPDLVFVITEDVSAGTAGAATVTYGVHTSTNAVITMTTGKTYRVVAVRFAAASKTVGAFAGPVAVALGNEAANAADVFMLKRGF
jgi:hypothetical protein